MRFHVPRHSAAIAALSRLTLRARLFSPRSIRCEGWNRRHWMDGFEEEQGRIHEILEIPAMDRAKAPLIRSESTEQSPIFSLEEHHSTDRVSCTTSIDGLSRSSCDGDLAGSPIDLICERQILAIDTSSSDDDERSPLGWPLARQPRSQLKLSPVMSNSCEGLRYLGSTEVVMPSSPQSAESSNVCDGRAATAARNHASEMEMMKERFSKLLLGEDMSGSGKGVCTALAISNALTNLAASVFGELWRLEPLSAERKALWAREMNWILSVCDHIVEFVPSFHSVTDGTNLEVMISRPRSDLQINLPALRKLDAMLLEALDSYKETDFWYVDQGVLVDVPSKNQQQQISVAAKREEDKWWLPIPKIPAGGLSEASRKALQNQRDCTNQVLKAAMAINEQVLSEMQVPDVYWESLPKSARANLGETIYYGLRQEHFNPDALLSCLDLSTEHSALEVANRIQSAMHIWGKKDYSSLNKDHGKSSANSRYSWLKVRDLVAECGDKRQLLIERADSLLMCLRQRFPGLPQTVLDVNKIQYNKDIGQAILESYSRVLESLAFSILSRIDDVLYIADMTKRNQDSSGSQVGSSTKPKLPPRTLHAASFHNRVSTTASFVTPLESPSSSPSSSVSPSLRRPIAGFTSPSDSATVEANPWQQGVSCPTRLGSLCSGESIEESKRPVKDRPWFVVESRKSLPPGRD